MASHPQFYTSRRTNSPIADPQIVDLIHIGQNRTTRHTRIAVRRAQDAALRFKHSAIGTEHRLLGILNTPDQMVSAMLEQQGFDRIQLRRALEEKLSPGTVPKPEAIPVTPACRQAFSFAVEEAANLHQQQVGLEHVLLGISREGSGIAGAFLESKYMTYQRLLQSLPPEASRPETA